MPVEAYEPRKEEVKLTRLKHLSILYRPDMQLRCGVTPLGIAAAGGPTGLTERRCDRPAATRVEREGRRVSLRHNLVQETV